MSDARTLWIAAESLNAARRVAYAIEAGRITAGERHLSEEAANAWAGELADLHRYPMPVFAIVMVKHTTQDGRIPVAWPLDRIGDIAAAITLFVAAPAIAARFWWLLS
ncbi:hypothetical protein [Bosea sp. BK604]|uniref:hypothetical protein n=1 Tax=Bosea sp. BK604 TaxID=2512180 RepID=UPI00104A2355|nr:hypothetical protein [Bosea sp. BK604]TCR64663.1 hypothetical protein EV560_106128 [Bosea sp. BK604]